MSKRLTGAATDLEKAVQDILNEMADDYETGVVGVLDDLMRGGCQSGMIGELVWYSDTIPFYQQHMDEIDGLLDELCRSTGLTPEQLFGESWDKEDRFCREQLNQNLMAWFGFEETARHLADSNGIEI